MYGLGERGPIGTDAFLECPRRGPVITGDATLSSKNAINSPAREPGVAGRGREGVSGGFRAGSVAALACTECADEGSRFAERLSPAEPAE